MLNSCHLATSAPLLKFEANLTHFNVGCKVHYSHYFAKLMLSLKHCQFLLLIKWNFIIVISGQPWMLQSSCRIISLRGRVGTKVQKEVSCKWREIGWEFPFDGLCFNIL